jgi:hypothetical protein
MLQSLTKTKTFLGILNKDISNRRDGSTSNMTLESLGLYESDFPVSDENLEKS